MTPSPTVYLHPERRYVSDQQTERCLPPSSAFSFYHSSNKDTRCRKSVYDIISQENTEQCTEEIQSKITQTNRRSVRYKQKLKLSSRVNLPKGTLTQFARNMHSTTTEIVGPESKNHRLLPLPSGNAPFSYFDRVLRKPKASLVGSWISSKAVQT